MRSSDLRTTGCLTWRVSWLPRTPSRRTSSRRPRRQRSPSVTGRPARPITRIPTPIAEGPALPAWLLRRCALLLSTPADGRRDLSRDRREHGGVVLDPELARNRE